MSNKCRLNYGLNTFREAVLIYRKDTMSAVEASKTCTIIDG